MTLDKLFNQVGFWIFFLGFLDKEMERGQGTEGGKMLEGKFEEDDES